LIQIKIALAFRSGARLRGQTCQKKSPATAGGA
jgi:hypothetical protein